MEIRQFEFNPTFENVCAAGTLHGAVIIGDHDANRVLGASRNAGQHHKDPVLGLCWLRRNPARLITGSGSGAVKLLDAGEVLGSMGEPADLVGSFNFSNSTPSHTGNDLLSVPDITVVHAYPAVKDLTCVHVSCDDKHMCTSGYTRDVQVFDLETGQAYREFKDAHSTHINITRFGNGSPNL